VVSCVYPEDWRGNPVVGKVDIDMGKNELSWKRIGQKVEWTDKPGEPFWGRVNGEPLKIRTIGVTGPFGSGKSLACDMIDARNTLKIDIESSSSAFNLPFKKHLVMYDEVKTKNSSGIPSPVECFVWFRDLLKGIDPGTYTVISVDPINEIQQGAYDYVVSHPKEFGRTSGQYDKMTALAWGDVKTMIDMMVGVLSGKIETFAYTMHMGQVWKAGKPSGEMKAKGSDVFRKMADVVFVLNRPVDPKTGKQIDAPIALITPPIGKSRLVHANADTGEIKPILPPAIHGLSATKIRDYIAKPPNYKKLKGSEIAPVETLNDDEKLQLRAQIAQDEREAEEAKNARLADVKDAAERNSAAKRKAAEPKKEAPVEAPDPSSTPEPVSAPADDKSTDSTTEPAKAAVEAQEEPEGKATTASPKDGHSSDVETPLATLKPEEKVELVRSQMKALGMSKEQSLKAIAKRGKEGDKLVDLTPEGLEDLRKALWSLQAKRDLAKK
jgi:hypothetical protein